MEYVYLVASLPRLELTGAPPITSAALLAASEGVLRRDHWDDLRAIVEERPRDVRSPEARALVDADAQLRVALARIRAQRAGVALAPPPHVPTEFDVRAAEVAARAMAIEDPLERELVLDRHRWALLDAAAAFPAFGVQAVFAYALKLRLVEKWTAMDEAEGLRIASDLAGRDLAGTLA